jgi:SAM-dependent methyltransferase
VAGAQETAPLSAARVRAYYDREAGEYQARFSRGPLGLLRERERAAILSLLEPRSFERILDAGCGTGFDAVPLIERGCEVQGVDLSEGMVSVARSRGVDAQVADLHDLDLSRSFDKILCAGPLEFCVSPGRVLRRLSDHLRPGGSLVVLFPPPTLSGRLYALYHRNNGLPIQLYDVPSFTAWMRAADLCPDALLRPGPFSVVVRARAAP